MTPKEFLEQLNPFSRVFDLSVDYKYTEYQMLLFAKLYHESELKNLRVGDVSVCACGSDKFYSEQYKDVIKYYCSKCHKNIESKH